MSPRSIRRAHARRIAREQRQAFLRRRRTLSARLVGGATGGAPLETGGAGLTLSAVAVTSSKSDDRGGGIYPGGTLTLSASTISANTADNGGGVYAESTGKYSQTARHKISDTTISGN